MITLFSTNFSHSPCYPLLGGDTVQSEYTVLFNGITNIIAALKYLQFQAEEAYIERLEREEQDNRFNLEDYFS